MFSSYNSSWNLSQTGILGLISSYNYITTVTHEMKQFGNHVAGETGCKCSF